MRIKNSALRKLEAKRLYLLGYSISEIIERVGNSLMELDRWRLEEGWDAEKKQLEEGRKRHRRNTIAHIDMIIKESDNPTVLSKVIALASTLPASDIDEIAKKIIKQFKGDSYE